MSCPDALNDIQLDYYGRIKLAISLGLDESFSPGLKFVGTLRNRFAHQLDAAIGDQDADAFDNALGPHKDMASESFETAQITAGILEIAAPNNRQDPKDRVRLGFVTLWAGMVVAVYRAAHVKDQI